MSAPPPSYTHNDDIGGLELSREHCSGAVWPAAHALLEYLQEGNGANLPANAAVLELGSGTGWLALKVAQQRNDITWCATEIEDHGAMERLARNISSAGKRLRAVSLDWKCAEKSKVCMNEKFDLIVGSDLVYSEDGAAALVSCLSCLLNRRLGMECTPPDVLIAQTCGRWGGYGYDEALFNSLKRAGLVADAVGGETLENSTEKRQHVVVFRVTALPRVSDERLADMSSEAGMDPSTHVLLRAKRLEKLAEKAMIAGMTEEERDEFEATKLFNSIC